VHLNFMILLGPPDQYPPFTPEELRYVAGMGRKSRAPGKPGTPWPNREGGYAIIQLTKPLTLSYAMTDSPVGAAAWMFERFRISAELPDGDPWSVFTREEILDNIMVYLVTGTFGTATWAYAAPHGEEGEELVPPGLSIGRTPLGIAQYRGEPVLPRSWVERNYNLVHWSDVPEGGHFAALEKPRLFVEDLRAFGRKIRTLKS
jgi:microsomal epoxide hydrolase